MEKVREQEPLPAKSETDMALDYLESTCIDFEAFLNKLEVRLSAVLKPNSEIETSKTKARFDSGLAQVIETKADKIALFLERAEDLLRRLQL